MDQSATLRRAGMGLVGVGYAGVFVLAAVLVTMRYLAEQRDPATFNGGMAAGGDWFLELFLVALLLIPTFFLALLIRNSEAAYTKFAQILLGFALSLPASMAIMAINAVGQGNTWLGAICLYRIFGFPMTLIGLAGCCVLAKFKRPRRLILYSAIIELASFILVAVLLR